MQSFVQKLARSILCSAMCWSACEARLCPAVLKAYPISPWKSIHTLHDGLEARVRAQIGLRGGPFFAGKRGRRDLAYLRLNLRQQHFTFVLMFSVSFQCHYIFIHQSYHGIKLFCCFALLVKPMMPALTGVNHLPFVTGVDHLPLLQPLLEQSPLLLFLA